LVLQRYVFFETISLRIRKFLFLISFIFYIRME
jgi:hypothetical protein